MDIYICCTAATLVFSTRVASGLHSECQKAFDGKKITIQCKMVAIAAGSNFVRSTSSQLQATACQGIPLDMAHLGRRLLICVTASIRVQWCNAALHKAAHHA